MQSWVAMARLKFVVSRKKINFIYYLCHVSLASCLFSLLPPVGCCCHSQFTFYSVICYLMDLSTRFPNMTFFPSWTRTVITKSTLREETYTELKNIKKERKNYICTILQQCSCPTALAAWGKLPFSLYFFPCKWKKQW